MNAFLRRLQNIFGTSKQLVPDTLVTVERAGQTVTPVREVQAEISATKPMASLSARTAAMIKPHVPLIKFRYSKGLMEAVKSSAGTTQRPKSTEINPARPGSSGSKGPSAVLDDLPPRYRRRRMSQEEIDAINTGGCAADPVKPVVGKSKPK